MPHDKPVLDAKTAMRLAKESYASTSDEKEVRNTMPVPAPHITMTAGNLLKFFQLASKGYQAGPVAPQTVGKSQPTECRHGTPFRYECDECLLPPSPPRADNKPNPFD